MKMLISILAMLTIVLLPVISAIVPNPIISRGQPVFTSSDKASYLVDNKFNTSKWTVSDNSWIAIQVDPGPTQVFLNWNNPSYPWSNELSPPSCPNSISFPVDYNILISSNSTNGEDGDWIIADSIRDNIVAARGHLIDFVGASWIKMHIISGGGQLDEVEVFDASSDDEDVWFFAGTSISANAFKGTPPAKNYADLVNQNHSEYNPVMIRGGIGCISSTDFVNNISRYLEMAGNANFWAIEMGTNDAWGGTNGNVAVFRSNLQRVIDSCKAHGIQPIIARVLATNESAVDWQVHPDFLNAVDNLTAHNNLIPGPDLYTWFLAHPGDLNSDGVHPNSYGAASFQRLWAEKMDSLYGGCAPVQIIPYIQVNTNDPKLRASATLNQNDTLIISPQVTIDGSWSWSGPDDFSADTREITVNTIQTIQAGNYVSTFAPNDTCTFTYSFIISVNEVSDLPSVQLNVDNVRIYPNPASEGRFIIITDNLSGILHMQIFDLLGSLTYSTLLNDKETIINTDLPRGVYIVKFSNGQNYLNQKLIVD